MSPTTEHLLKHALALSEEERLQLIEALLAATGSEDEPPFPESWREVIEQRSAEIDSGEAELVPWSTIRQSIRQRLRMDG